MSTAFTTLLKLRQVAFAQCRIELGNARRIEQESRGLLSSVRTRQAVQFGELDTQTSWGPIPVSTLRRRHEHLTDLAVQLQQSEKAVAAAEQEAARRVQELVASQQQLKIAEKLIERAGLH
jgi:flagellar biosynthesis chaperone FliJ